MKKLPNQVDLRDQCGPIQDLPPAMSTAAAAGGMVDFLLRQESLGDRVEQQIRSLGCIEPQLGFALAKILRRQEALIQKQNEIISTLLIQARGDEQ